MRKAKHRDVNTEAYAVVLRRLDSADGGGWLAEVPDLPGCMSDGTTPAAAVKNAQDAIRSAVLTLRALGRRVPPPRVRERFSGQFRLRLPRSLHRRLVERAKREDVSLNTLALSLIAQGLGSK